MVSVASEFSRLNSGAVWLTQDERPGLVILLQAAKGPEQRGLAREATISNQIQISLRHWLIVQVRSQQIGGYG